MINFTFKYFSLNVEVYLSTQSKYSVFSWLFHPPNVTRSLHLLDHALTDSVEDTHNVISKDG